MSEIHQNGGINARNTKNGGIGARNTKIEASVPETPQNGGIGARNTTKRRHQCPKHHKTEAAVQETPQNGGTGAQNTTKHHKMGQCIHFLYYGSTQSGEHTDAQTWSTELSTE